MVLAYPDFTMTRPAGLAKEITDAEWWLWLRLHELEPSSQLGGILAWKSGFHSTGDYNRKNHPGNYSIRDLPNRTGPWWEWKSSALDWTFPEAHNGDYGRISRYTKRLLASAKDANDPRLDLVLYEFFGQADTDRVVEGFNEWKEADASSDLSHLWHLHFSFLRKACGDFWAMWALLTVLMGWTVAQWRASLPGGTGQPDTTPTGVVDMYMAQVTGNDSVYVSDSQTFRGIDYPTFRWYVDVLKLPFTGVANRDALLARCGAPLESTIEQPGGVLTEDQMERVRVWITDAVGKAGEAAGTISPDVLRTLLDDESISLDELRDLALAAGEREREAVAASVAANPLKE